MQTAVRLSFIKSCAYAIFNVRNYFCAANESHMCSDEYVQMWIRRHEKSIIVHQRVSLLVIQVLM